jgi:hypothetical protein
LFERQRLGGFHDSISCTIELEQTAEDVVEKSENDFFCLTYVNEKNEHD